MPKSLFMSLPFDVIENIIDRLTFDQLRVLRDSGDDVAKIVIDSVPMRYICAAKFAAKYVDGLFVLTGRRIETVSTSSVGPDGRRCEPTTTIIDAAFSAALLDNHMDYFQLDALLRTKFCSPQSITWLVHPGRHDVAGRCSGTVLVFMALYHLGFLSYRSADAADDAAWSSSWSTCHGVMAKKGTHHHESPSTGFQRHVLTLLSDYLSTFRKDGRLIGCVGGTSGKQTSNIFVDFLVDRSHHAELTSHSIVFFICHYMDISTFHDLIAVSEDDTTSAVAVTALRDGDRVAFLRACKIDHHSTSVDKYWAYNFFQTIVRTLLRLTRTRGCINSDAVWLTMYTDMFHILRSDYRRMSRRTRQL